MRFDPDVEPMRELERGHMPVLQVMAAVILAMALVLAGFALGALTATGG